MLSKHTNCTSVDGCSNSLHFTLLICSILLANCSNYLIILVVLLLHIGSWINDQWLIIDLDINYTSFVSAKEVHSSWGLEIEEIVRWIIWSDWEVWGCKYVSTNIRWTAFSASSPKLKSFNQTTELKKGPILIICGSLNDVKSFEHLLNNEDFVDIIKYECESTYLFYGMT